MSNQTSDAELDQNGKLMHYRATILESDFEDMTKEDLWENYKSLVETNNKIAVQYENAKYREDLYAKANAQLKGDLEKWKYAARKLFYKACQAKAVMQTVSIDLEWSKGFTHHMKSVVNQLNQDEMKEAMSDLDEPTATVRDLMKEDGGLYDIPF